MRHLDRNQVWSVAKAAIHAYEEDPKEINASRVAMAVKLIRGMNEESIWRQSKGTSPSLKPVRQDDEAASRHSFW